MFLVFSKTVEYVLQPTVIEKVAELVAKKFNSEISKSTTIVALERDLKEKEKLINALMGAIEKGILAKTTQSRLLMLEEQKDEIEDKLVIEKSRSVKPLEVVAIKKFLNFYAQKHYDNDEEKNDFFNRFINRVILFDDRLKILYSTTFDTQKEECDRELKSKNTIFEMEKTKKTTRLNV